MKYILYFRGDGKIKHCRIELDGRLYVIGEANFESLVDLVQYYEKNPLYNRIKLKYPVNQALVDRRGSVSIKKMSANYLTDHLLRFFLFFFMKTLRGDNSFLQKVLSL
jgi:hypothetical protein